MDLFCLSHLKSLHLFCSQGVNHFLVVSTTPPSSLRSAEGDYKRDINQLSNTTTTGFGNLSTQLCNCCSDINSNISNGFYNTATNLCNLRSDILMGNANTQRDILLQRSLL